MLVVTHCIDFMTKLVTAYCLQNRAQRTSVVLADCDTCKILRGGYTSVFSVLILPRHLAIFHH